MRIVKRREALRDNPVETENSSKKYKKPLDKPNTMCYNALVNKEAV